MNELCKIDDQVIRFYAIESQQAGMTLQRAVRHVMVSTKGHYNPEYVRQFLLQYDPDWH